MGKSSRRVKDTSAKMGGGDQKSLQSSHDPKPLQKISMQRPHDFKYFLAALVGLATVAVYLSSLSNEFAGWWDDSEYVYENPYIRSFNVVFFKWAFLNFYASNWHPLTWISHALDYAIWGLNPVGHHLTNLIIHAINSFLVVVLIIKLLEIYQERVIRDGSTTFIDRPRMLIVGVVTGLLFGLHPLHVESVAWVSERKDLLCTLFFLISSMTYTGYVTTGITHQKWMPRFFNMRYLLSLGFFALALLSKPMAVSLPLVFLILDWYPFKRIQSVKSFLSVFVEKLPFIALSLISSILTILAQRAGGTMGMMVFVPFSIRLLVAAKTLVAYILNMILPTNLIPYYSYPKNVTFFSLEYLSAVILITVITVMCILCAKRQKVFLTVWGYYVVTLMPVIGIVQVGEQAMADRYTYLPSLGPFLIAGLLIAWIYGRVHALQRWSNIIKVLLLAITLLMFSVLASLTSRQIAIWKNPITLWTYVIEREPTSVPGAYVNRGVAFFEEGQLNKAIKDFNMALFLDSFSVDAYYERGTIFFEIGQFDKAVADLDKAISLIQYGAKSSVGVELFFLNRGFAYSRLNQNALAASDFKKACELGSLVGCNMIKNL
jgi:Tfp pilus assembly protein PilF